MQRNGHEVIEPDSNIAQKSGLEVDNDKSNKLESLSEDESESSWSSLDEKLLHENETIHDDTNYNPAEDILRALRAKNQLVQHEINSGFRNSKGVEKLLHFYSEVQN